jgi:excisionase family DNA binding protein
MTTQILQFRKLQDHDRKQIGFVPGKDGQVELHLRTGSKTTETVALPREVNEMIEVLLDHLARGEEVAILTEDQELSPNDVARVLGVSRPLVVHRMDTGELPFRYVGKHRRAKLKDVLALKTRIDAQQFALDALADDTEELMRDHAI